jgi:hypothetical protein
LVDRKDEPALSLALFRAVMDHGVIVPIHDKESVGEDDEHLELLGELNHNTIQERLQLLANNKSYSYALTDELNENGDAATSDIVFQFLVMGDYVFS